MIRFAAGLAIIVFSLILGIYRYLDNADTYDARAQALSDSLEKRDQGKNLQERIKVIRSISLENKSVQKYTLENMLDIKAPRMEWRTVGQPLVRGANRALYRYNFRISGPSTFAESQALMERMVKMPGFVPYSYCFACSSVPRGTEPGLNMVQIEGYLYAYDPDKLY